MEFYQGFYLFLRKGIEIGSMVCLSRSDRQIFNQARSQFNKRKNYRELVKSVTDTEVICHGDDQIYTYEDLCPFYICENPDLKGDSFISISQDKNSLSCDLANSEIVAWTKNS